MVEAKRENVLVNLFDLNLNRWSPSSINHIRDNGWAYGFAGYQLP